MRGVEFGDRDRQTPGTQEEHGDTHSEPAQTVLADNSQE